MHYIRALGVQEGLAMVGLLCEGVSQWFCCVAHGVPNGFAALYNGLAKVLLNCDKNGHDTFKCQTLSHVWVLRLNNGSHSN